MNSKYIKRIKARMGSGVVSIYTTDDMINTFIDEAIDKMIPYCANGGREVSVASVGADGKVTTDIRMSKVLNVFPILPGKGNTGFMSLFPKNILGYAQNFTWNIIGDSIYVSGSRQTVYIEHLKDKEFTIDDLSEFYKDLAIKWAIALVKESESKIRGKFVVSSSPFETDASELRGEAETMMSEVNEILNSQPLFKGATVHTF